MGNSQSDWLHKKQWSVYALTIWANSVCKWDNSCPWKKTTIQALDLRSRANVCVLEHTILWGYHQPTGNRKKNLDYCFLNQSVTKIWKWKHSQKFGRTQKKYRNTNYMRLLIRPIFHSMPLSTRVSTEELDGKSERYFLSFF